MKKSREKPSKVSRFNLRWDKNAQSTSRQSEYSKACRKMMPRLEEYFEFLSDIEPPENLPPKTGIVEKQFTL